MLEEYDFVPEEVNEMIDTGIFWMKYTHVTTNLSRCGVEKVGRLMCPSVALSHDIVHFSGEFAWFDGFTYLFRHYSVSLSNFPTTQHHWSSYTKTPYVWNPDDSDRFISILEEEIRKTRDGKRNRVDFENPQLRKTALIQLGECIEYERKRQEIYEIMSDDEKSALEHQTYDLYALDSSLSCSTIRTIFDGSAEHPIVIGDINLQKYLRGIFRKEGLEETRAWISDVIRRSVPVASFNALATWENIYPKLHSRDSFLNNFAFYETLRTNTDLQEKVIREVREGKF